MKFLRYPGGKRKFLSYLVNFIPRQDEIKGKYIEPFVGGGSVFLHLRPSEAIISDLNPELIELYKGIKLYPHKVWEIFEAFPSDKKGYYNIRDTEYKHKPLYYRAARTLYLNRTCFKGMWRHNPQGNFNVGYGGEARRWVITHQNIVELSNVFRKAEINQADFQAALSDVSKGDFVFLDPPYKPGEKEMKTAHYINGKFPFEDQVRLSETLKELSSKKKFKWLMTNSSHSEILKLYNYKGLKVRRIPIGTSTTVGVLTKNSNEVLISNY